MQEHLALTLKVTQQRMSYHLKWLKLIQKQGNFVTYELEEPNLNGWQAIKDFVHRMVPGDEILTYNDNSKRRKSWEPGHDLTLIVKPNIYEKKHVVHLVGSAWYRILSVAHTKRN